MIEHCTTMPGHRQSKKLAWTRLFAMVMSLIGTTMSAPAQAQESGEQDDIPPATGNAGTSGQGAAGNGNQPGTAELEPLGDDSASNAFDEDAPWNKGTNIEQRRKARESFLEANQLARKRFQATAATKYKDAIELWSNPAFYYNLALAQIHLDQPIEAYESLTRAMQHGRAPLADRYEQASRLHAELKKKLGHIDVVCDEPGATVMLNGKVLFTGPGRYQGAVLPGAHQLVGTRTGLTAVVMPAVLSPGQSSQFELVFEHPEIRMPVRRWSPWLSWSVVSVGAAALVAGAYLDWDSSRAFDTYDEMFRERCRGGCEDDAISAELDEHRQGAESKQQAALVTYAAGGAMMITGAVLVYLGRMRLVRAPPDSERSAVIPMVSADSVGARAVFRF